MMFEAFFAFPNSLGNENCVVVLLHVEGFICLLSLGLGTKQAKIKAWVAKITSF